MIFERGVVAVSDVQFGEQTELCDRILLLDKKGLSDFLLSLDDTMESCTVSITRPGDSTRILCVKDVVQPGCKVRGDRPGRGKRHVLENVTVVTCGKIVGYQEGIIDMSGAGALYSPFSRTFNVVLDIAVIPGLTPHEHEETVRKAGLAAAAFLGETSRSVTPETMQSFTALEELPTFPDLPRIVYLYMLLSQGLLHDTYVLGRNASEGLPRIIDPLILLDNAITSGNCVSACDKNTTWHHQNNPVLRELWQRHGRDLNFSGVVLTTEPIRLAAKEAGAQKSIALIQELKADGVILSKEGFGNPDADQMLLTRGLEQQGIKVVAITDEFAGADGFSQSLADSAVEADAVVSVGNANERVMLPPMQRLLGPVSDLSKLAGAWPHSLQEDGSLEVELQAIIGATNELGMQTLSCREI
ncbi:MAG: glycine/sarcosine/betaine reductase component B subunit [Proteobacteria bacterium]|nr:glycine/sarcosine/betaine reductase component B subunit [Pseudomonadota bacterium]MBU1419897.1 glycine/sarcosine/betaine reductase component B subunit [Pseudomonadota bacterium]